MTAAVQCTLNDFELKNVHVLTNYCFCSRFTRYHQCLLNPSL